MPSFTVKAWRDVRPKSAKDTGVAGAIELVAKAYAKDVPAMSQAEIKVAKAALEGLSSALAKGKKAIDEDTKDKDRTAALALIEKWQKEIKTLTAELAMNAAYGIRLVAVQEEYDKQYQRLKTDVDTYHYAAALHNRNATRPSDVDLQRYLVAVRDGGNICSKQSIPNVLAEAKTIKVADINLAADVKLTKTKIDQLMDWCTAFAKLGKTDARNRAAALDDTVAVEKAIKKVMDSYTDVERDMKALITQTKQQATLGQQLADKTKAAIQQGNTDKDFFANLVKAIKVVATALKKCDDDLRTIGDQWRTSSSPIGTLVSACRKVAGYDEATHGKLMIDRMQANQMLIRQVSIPLGDGTRQIERAKRLLTESTSHRGYASGL